MKISPNNLRRTATTLLCLAIPLLFPTSSPGDPPVPPTPGKAPAPAIRWEQREVPLDAAIRQKYPETIVLVTAAHSNGPPNIITVGWSMFCSGDPVMVAIAIGKQRYSHGLIAASRSFVYCFPDAAMEKAVRYCGTHSGKNVDKFKETGLTPLKGKQVAAPLIQECPVNFECEVVQAVDAGSHTIFIGRVVAAWMAQTNTLPPRLYNLGGGQFLPLP
ncbi:MAG: hypothetical protein A2498_07945 [Lentisphaerae bacterium RIFOXYC12_FULL_60_16]|nr:MAG: hypothetical protein A2498_07945 [Lentisphaerae bacterium RIFOXYC12_FULL_60_16]OGV77016.1 MAG: hypothetical protein A2340_15650 [Lentisphaerae bacterium RIFOXYB12_FULL_60_10]